MRGRIALSEETCRKMEQGGTTDSRRRWMVVNEKGKQALFDDFATKLEAEQAHLDLVYGAKLGDTKKGNDYALRYMRWRVVQEPEKNTYTIQYHAVKNGKTYKMMKEVPKSDYSMWEQKQNDGQITNLEKLDV